MRKHSQPRRTCSSDAVACVSRFSADLRSSDDVVAFEGIGAELIGVSSGMPSDAMAKLFAKEEDGKRRVYLSTNVAESSITLPGLTAVVDSGYHKHIKSAEDGQGTMLETARITKANADQRAGRVGRMAGDVITIALAKVRPPECGERARERDARREPSSSARAHSTVLLRRRPFECALFC